MVRSLWNACRGRPRAAILAAALLCALVVGGCMGGYVQYQWHVAQEAVKDEARVDEARRRLDWCVRVWPWSQSVRVRLLAARAARMSGDFAGAEDHLKRCLRLQGGASDPVQLEFFL